ncbi:MAG: hypothetical protein O3B01_09430 [Planctomycetota bacterium]|nr:hypothetical protein [Planctomycetota bacterium]MDA1138790.1 hypothetical protein [Planctomycetota bacterium]
MTIQINLSAEELQTVQRLTEEEDGAMAIQKAMESFIRHRAAIELKEMCGKIEVNEDWRDTENVQINNGQ